MPDLVTTEPTVVPPKKPLNLSGGQLTTLNATAESDTVEKKQSPLNQSTGTLTSSGSGDDFSEAIVGSFAARQALLSSMGSGGSGHYSSVRARITSVTCLLLIDVLHRVAMK